MDEKQHVKTPEGVAKLLEELWIRHRAAIKQLKKLQPLSDTLQT